MAVPEQEHEAIIRGILRVEAQNKRVLDPNGNMPVCRPKLGGGGCERCGCDDVSTSEPCPAVPPEQRWRMVFEDESED